MIKLYQNLFPTDTLKSIAFKNTKINILGFWYTKYNQK